MDGLLNRPDVSLPKAVENEETLLNDQVDEGIGLLQLNSNEQQTQTTSRTNTGCKLRLQPSAAAAGDDPLSRRLEDCAGPIGPHGRKNWRLKVLIGFATVLAVLFLASSASSKITKELKKLNQEIKEMKKGPAVDVRFEFIKCYFPIHECIKEKANRTGTKATLAKRFFGRFNGADIFFNMGILKRHPNYEQGRSFVCKAWKNATDDLKFVLKHYHNDTGLYELYESKNITFKELANYDTFIQMESYTECFNNLTVCLNATDTVWFPRAQNLVKCMRAANSSSNFYDDYHTLLECRKKLAICPNVSKPSPSSSSANFLNLWILLLSFLGISTVMSSF